MKLLPVMLIGLLVVSCGSVRSAYSADEGKSASRPATAVQAAPKGKLTAPGTVEPEVVVDACAQVAGRIVRLGTDAGGKPIDYGSPVEAGTVLAQIDSDLYTVRVERERAACARAEAELAQATIHLERAQAQWQRAQDQKKNNAVSDADFTSANFDYRAAQAAVAVAQAVLAQNKAALKEAEIELSRTAIRSPIQGVVIDRRVSVGQMVGPAANAPGAFLVGKLDKLQVWASVRETDIARVHPQQPVRFTVDAYPGDVFQGKVEQVRLNATMTQNVVTYTVVVAVSNPPKKLLPYLTVRVEFD